MCILEMHSIRTYLFITHSSSCTSRIAHEKTKVEMREAPNGRVREEETCCRGNEDWQWKPHTYPFSITKLPFLLQLLCLLHATQLFDVLPLDRGRSWATCSPFGIWIHRSLFHHESMLKWKCHKNVHIIQTNPVYFFADYLKLFQISSS